MSHTFINREMQQIFTFEKIKPKTVCLINKQLISYRFYRPLLFQPLLYFLNPTQLRVAQDQLHYL